MMNEFEEKLLTMNSDFSPKANPDEFLTKLHGRIQQSHQNKQTALTSFMLLLIVGFLSFSPIGTSLEIDQVFADETEEYFETDFWALNTDSLEIDDSYTEDLAYYLFAEGDLWDTLDLLNEIELEEERTL